MARDADTSASPRTRLYRRRNPGERWWFAFLVLPAALTALLIYQGGEAIEAELRDDATAALRSAGLPGTTVEMQGRRATLLVPTGENQESAIEAVASVEGLGDVTAENVASSAAEAKACRNMADKLDVNNGRGIPFQGGSTAMTADGQRAIPVIVKLLARCPIVTVVVEGHVDPTVLNGGTVSLNRANVVRNALIKAGIGAERIEARGFGDTFTLSQTNSGLNNRVAVVLVGE